MKHNFLAWRYLDAATDTGGGQGALVKSINDNFTKTTEQIEAVKTQHKKDLADAEAKYQKAIDDLKKANDEDIQKAKGIADAAQKEVEDLKKQFNSPTFQQGRAGTKSFSQAFEETMNDAKHKSALSKKEPNYPIELSTKAVGDMSSSANLTGSYFVAPDVKPGIIVRPYNQLHMRDLLPIGNTASNLIRYVRDNGGEGGPGMVAEMGTKPEMDRDLSIEDAPVRKVATHLRVPEEMIEDIPYLVSFINNIGTLEVMAVEDAEIIYGDGTGQHLSGLFTNATAFSAGTSAGKFGVAGTAKAANQFDVLKAARKQMRLAKRTPSFALVSPTDYFEMTSQKDTTGNYILAGGGNGLVPALDGVPIVEMNQINDGDFLLGDRNAAEIDFRQNVIVRFFDQDRDNAIKNAVTIVIEERLALPIYYTSGFVKGTFSAAYTGLNAAS